MMPELDFYLSLIPAQHKDKPNFMAVVQARIESYVKLQEFLASMPREFDLDFSIGKQLDHDGEWIGRTRYLGQPLVGVYFSWGITGLGWGEGVWKGEFDPESGLVRLPDDVYRRLLKAKAAANSWDGTIPGAYEVWGMAFEDSGSILFIEDRQDMSMIVGIAGTPPDAVMKALFKQDYLPLKPEGVRIRDYLYVDEAGPLFAWNCENEALNGWGVGHWPVAIQ